MFFFLCYMLWYYTMVCVYIISKHTLLYKSESYQLPVLRPEWMSETCVFNVHFSCLKLSWIWKMQTSTLNTTCIHCPIFFWCCDSVKECNVTKHAFSTSMSFIVVESRLRLTRTANITTQHHVLYAIFFWCGDAVPL